MSHTDTNGPAGEGAAQKNLPKATTQYNNCQLLLKLKQQQQKIHYSLLIISSSSSCFKNTQLVLYIILHFILHLILLSDIQM